MFGDVNFGLHSVHAFNTEIKELWRNSEPAKEGETRAIVLVDASGSMRDKQGEMKLTASALKCMTGTIGQWNLPDPTGGTTLVDSVTTTAAMANTAHVQPDASTAEPAPAPAPAPVHSLCKVDKIIVLSDGDDTASVTTNLIASIAEDGSPVLVGMPNRGATQARRNAVAKHISNLGVELFVIGVGREVKEFIAACAKPGLRINTALLEHDVTAEQVAGVMKTVLKKKKKAKEAADETVTAANAEAVTAEETAVVATEAARTSTQSERTNNPKLLRDGLPYDPEAEARYVTFITSKEAAKIGADKQTVAMAVHWFRSLMLSRPNQPLAADLIGGRLYPEDRKGRRSGAVFNIPPVPAPPERAEGEGEQPEPNPIKASAWVNTLGRCVELLARDPENILDRVDGLREAFATNHFSGTVGPLFCDMGGSFATHLALTKAELPQLDERVLYYKFKADTYPHYLPHHRANAYQPDLPVADVSKIAVVWRGNSSAKSYGGPVLDGAGPMVIAPSSDAESVAEALAEEVTGLKRKIDELETTNKRLKAEVDALRSAPTGEDKQ